jgi:hypothetical protein
MAMVADASNHTHTHTQDKLRYSSSFMGQQIKDSCLEESITFCEICNPQHNLKRQNHSLDVNYLIINL